MNTRRNVLIAGILAAALSVVTSSIVLAGTPSTVSGPVSMQGRAAVVDTQRGNQLRLKAQDTGGAGWLLEVALDPVSARSSGSAGGEDDDRPASGGGGLTIDLSGSFTLGADRLPAASGTATGWLNESGNGELSLSDPAHGVSIDMPLLLNDAGSLTARLLGQLPALPALPGTASKPTPAVPAQPANHFFWYISRTSAMVAFGLLFINICLGFALKVRSLARALEAWNIADLHKVTAIMSIGLIAMHMFSLLGDHYLKYTMSGLFVPGASPYRPVWTTLGILGFYGVVLVAVSVFFRKFMGYKSWRVFHYMSYVLFFVILIHSAAAGTDTAAPWAVWTYVLTGAIVAFIMLWRLFVPSAREEAESSFPAGSVPAVEG